MAPLLYMTPSSPPSRAVLMTAKSLGLQLEHRIVDLVHGEHKTAQFLQMNPLHSVPVLKDDDGFIVHDSHAIMPYIIVKYGPEDSPLYPRDVKQRALVDQCLHFDSGIAFTLILKIVRPLVFHGRTTIEAEDAAAAGEVYGYTEALLQDHEWIAGNAVTIADYSLISTISSLDTLVKIDSGKFPRVIAWLKRAEALPVHSINKAGLDLFDLHMKKYLS